MNTIQLEVRKRAELGRKDAKAARRSDRVPAVLYGGEENYHFDIAKLDARPVVYTPDFNIVELNIDGTTKRAVLKDLQAHPVTDELVHLDFMELVDDKKVIVDLPLEFTGLAAGVKAGGRLLAQMRKLRVKAFPKDLVSPLKVDVTNLELGKSIKVRELSYDGIEIMNSAGSPVVNIEIPRSLRSKKAAAEKE